jgi:hypothetical protein
VSHSYGSAGTYVVRLQVKDAVGDASETTRTVTVGSTTQPPPPSATTGAATAVSTSGATLNGSVNANGTSTSVVFQYGTTSAYGSQTPAQDAGAGTTAVAVQAVLTGLSPGTTYHFRIVATSARGTTNGADATFTTAVVVQPPTATTQAPTHFPGGKAQFAGIVNPGGGATTYFFRYGTTTAYGSQTQTATLTAGTADVNVSANSAKLVSGTVYHVQLVATNAAGTAYGADVAFTAR